MPAENHPTHLMATPRAHRGGPGPCPPSEVRSAVRRAVAGPHHATGLVHDEECLADALLAASELTTDAIPHGGGVTAFDIGVDIGDPAAVRVFLSDRGDLPPVAHDMLDEQSGRRPGGRGRPIVRRLARDIRVSGRPTGGKRVTAAVPAR